MLVLALFLQIQDPVVEAKARREQAGQYLPAIPRAVIAPPPLPPPKTHPKDLKRGGDHGYKIPSSKKSKSKKHKK